MNVLYDSKHDESTRRERLYAGDIYVYSPTPATNALVKLARNMCEAAFDPHLPIKAHQSIGVDDYIEVLKALKPAFIHHPDCKSIIPSILHDLRCELPETYFDVPRLRTACPHDYLATGMAYAFKPHRDTWYSPPMSQLNWWIPVYEMNTENTMAFHPRYWSQPVKNNSAAFDYQDWNSNGRVAAASQSTTKDTRFQSAAIEPLELTPDTRLVCEPGSVIVFSAAHLHSTVPNTSESTRISIDFRTVDARDVAQDRGAPNVDSESTGTTLMDYLRCTDLAHFSDTDITRLSAAPRIPLFPTDPALIQASLNEGA